MSTKVEIAVRQDARDMNCENIPMGQYFFGTIGEFKNKLFVRMWDTEGIGLILLEDPSRTWRFTINMIIENYIPINKVTISC